MIYKKDQILKSVFIWSLVILLGNILLEVSCVGNIYPPGPLFKEVGDDINLICVINSKYMEGRNSSFLSFFVGQKHIEVPRETITPINSTAISYTLKNAPEMKEQYQCKLKLNNNKTMGVDIKHIVVGTAPKNVTGFKCRSHNFEYFLCEFDVPTNNILPNFTLTYYIRQTVYTCPLNNSSTKYYCNMTLGNQLYRQVYEHYFFTLESTNQFGHHVDNFSINHFDSVIPEKPSFEVVNITATRAVLKWNIKSLYKEKGLVYDINILSAYSNDVWTKLDTSEMPKKSKEYEFILDNLYPHTWYQVQVRTRVATADDLPEMWNERNRTFQTLPEKPGEPPQVDIGSFNLQYNGSVVLYWKILPKYKENAPNIRYIITEIKENNTIVDMIPEETSESSAKYRLKPMTDYEFSVRTANDQGRSEAASVLRIPRKKYPIPERLKKIYYQDKYTLIWNAPTTDLKVKDYTVFSCISKAEFVDQCESDFTITHVNHNARNITYDTKERMNFAISANYIGASSGMIWAMCTALEGGGIGTMRPIQTFTNATAIRLEWNLECVYSSILKGYHLRYCPISEATNATCITPDTVIQIPGEDKEYYLTNLKPYTTYRIYMSMYSNLNNGPPSKAIYTTTMEAAPSPPRRLTYSKISVNSVVLKWTAPEYFNGKIRKYRIVYNSEKYELDTDLIGDDKKEIEFKLNNLSSYTCYKIYVYAETTESSNPSNDIHIRTAVGTPGPIEQPNSTVVGAYTTITWEPPIVPSGRVEYYELLMIVTQGSVQVFEATMRINGTRCTLPHQGCEHGSKVTAYHVRAVNVEFKEDEEYQGTCTNYGVHAKRDTQRVSELHIDAINSSYLDTTPKTLTIFKRHSNAEIDVFHDSNRIIRLNNTLANDFTSKKIRNDGEKMIYRCEEDDEKLDEWLNKNKRDVKLLPGTFSKPSTAQCYNGNNNYKALVIIFVILGVIITAVVGYFASRKFQKMKDIDITFPPGLTDLVQDNHPKGLDNVITRNIGHSDESLFKNENHRLLSNRLDAGYHNGIDCTDKAEVIGYEINSDDVGRDEENSGPSDSVEMSDISDSTNSSPAESPNPNPRSDHMTAAPKPSFVPVIINGYVQQQSIQPMLQKREPTIPPILPIISSHHPISNTNYIKCSLTNENDTTKHKDPNITSEMNENICGYVTPKQLSEFGQRLQ